MLTNIGQNLLVLIVCWVLTTGAGIYATFVYQPKELERVQKAEQLQSLKKAEITSLLAEAASSKAKADEAVARWMSRYKVIPTNLTSADVVGQFTRMSGVGFNNIDVTLDETKPGEQYSMYTFSVSGKASYGSLYRFLWDLENGTRMYRVRDLSLTHEDVTKKLRGTDKERRQVMVSFTMKVDAYFGGKAGISAPDSSHGPTLQTVPATVLPMRNPAINPFFPAIHAELPPNTYDLVDIETAKLIAIVGNEAVFEYNGGIRRVKAGQAVYLGRLQSIHAQEGSILIHMNKGGIVDEVEMRLNTEPKYRQALGPVQLAPAR